MRTLRKWRSLPALFLEPCLQTAQSAKNDMSTELMTELLEAGVHFGHQTKRWNPKMKPYIFEKRNAIYLIDLAKTVGQLDAATKFLSSVAGNGGKVLFVGTKKQAQAAIK